MSASVESVTSSDLVPPQREVFDLEVMPSIAPLIWRSIGTRKRKPAGDAVPPLWEFRIAGVKADPMRLARYREVCGFKDDGQLPILYPQVMASPLHMSLMSREGFPYSVMGIIHVTNVTSSTRAIENDESFALSVRCENARPARFGTEFDLVTELTDGTGEKPWRAVTTILQRGEQHPITTRDPMVPVQRKLSNYAPIKAPAAIGRRYARAAQEYNPIHLSRRTAKMLGFDRAIAHGMWEAAASIAVLPARQGGWRRHEVRFKQPFFLPGAATVRYYPVDSGYDLALVGADGTVYLEGRVR